MGELGSRRHVEFAKRHPEVVLDGARADEQLRRDLAVGVALSWESRDLRLLRGELVERLDRSLAGVLTGRRELDPCALGERLHPEVREQFVGEPELRPGVQPTARAPQPLAVEEMRPGKVETQARRLQPSDRLAIEGAAMMPSPVRDRDQPGGPRTTRLRSMSIIPSLILSGSGVVVAAIAYVDRDDAMAPVGP